MSHSDDEILPKYKDADTEKWRQLIGLAVGIIAIGIASMLMFGDSIWKIIAPVYDCESKKSQRLVTDLYINNIHENSMDIARIVSNNPDFMMGNPTLKNIKTISRPDPAAEEKTYSCQATIYSIWPASRKANIDILKIIDPSISADGDGRLSHDITYEISDGDKEIKTTIHYPVLLNSIFIDLAKKPNARVPNQEQP